MKVHVYAADRGGCGFYRAVAPAIAARNKGLDVKVVPYVQGESEFRVMVDKDDVVHDIDPSDPCLEADVVVVQRPMRKLYPQLIRKLQERGIAVVLDIDDDLRYLSPRHYTYKDVHPKTSPEINWHYLVECAKIATVTATTPLIARNYSGTCIPNYIPESYLSVVPEQKLPVIGWTGAVAFHPDDLDVTRGAVAKVLARHPEIGFCSVGPPESIVESLRIPANRYKCLGWADMEDYPALMSQFQVGIVPLQPTRFNDAKSYLKGLEMSAFGIPFVASPVESYRTLHGLGAGLLADSPREWERSINRLLVNDNRSLVDAGREAASKLTIEGHVDEWITVWTNAKKNL